MINKLFFFAIGILIFLILGVVSLPVFFPQTAISGHSFVSDRADLTNCDKDELPYINERVMRYFKQSKVPMPAAANIHIATITSPSDVLLVQCSLPSNYLKRFVTGKVPVKESMRDIMAELQHTGCIGANIVETNGMSDKTLHQAVANPNYGQSLDAYPYNRLTWWPLNEKDYSDMQVYQGKTEWRTWDVGPGAAFYLFVNQKKKMIYILGW